MPLRCTGSCPRTTSTPPGRATTIEDEWFRDRGRRTHESRSPGMPCCGRAPCRTVGSGGGVRRAKLRHGRGARRSAGPHAVAFGWRSLDRRASWQGRARPLDAPVADRGRGAPRARDVVVERLLSILGFVEFTAGDHEAADRALTQMRQRYDSMGVTEPLLDSERAVSHRVAARTRRARAGPGDPAAARGAGAEVPAPVDRRDAAAGAGARARGRGRSGGCAGGTSRSSTSRRPRSFRSSSAGRCW